MISINYWEIFIYWLQSTIGLATQELSNLFQTSQGDKDLNSPTEAEKKSALIERKLQDSHLDLINPKMD